MADVNTQQDQQVENQPETNEPSQEAKLAEYYKNEFEKMKAEVRELVTQRDLHKKESQELKSKYSRTKPTETDEYKELFTQNKELKEQLDLIRNGQELEKKKTLFINKARERGMSEDALKSIDVFNIDYSSINPEEEISAEILVESIKKNLNFLFQEKKSTPTAPNKLVEGDKTDKQKYEELLAKGMFFEAKEVLEKMNRS